MNQEGMNPILTDEELITIADDEQFWDNHFGSQECDAYALARAIEQAILNKLSEQNESVVFYLCEGCGHYYQTPVTSCDCMADLPLIVTTFFTRPSPSVPKGWTAIHLKTGIEAAD
jgi:hypothetical protein